MKTIYTCLVLAFAIHLFGQAPPFDGQLKLKVTGKDKFYEEEPNTLFEKEIPGRQLLVNEDDRLDSLYEYTWDTELLEWTPRLKEIIESNGQVTTSMRLSWNGNEYEKSFLDSMIYDDQGNLLNNIQTIWNGSGWSRFYQDVYTYDDDNNVTSYVVQSWNSTQWRNVGAVDYTYDDQNNLLTRTAKTWVSIAWVNSTLQINTYDTNNLRIHQLRQKWNSGWENTFQTMFTYNANNDLAENLNQKWTGGSWNDDNKYTYYYDSNNLLIEVLKQTSVGGGFWSYDSRDLYTYDGENVINIEYQEYASGWQGVLQLKYGYDERQNIISEVLQNYDTLWVNQDSTHYFYSIGTSTKDVVNEGDVQIFPNPVTSSLTVNIVERNHDDVGIEIFNSAGIRMIVASLNSSKSNDIDISRLVPGIYYILIYHDHGSIVRNFVKM